MDSIHENLQPQPLNFDEKPDEEGTERITKATDLSNELREELEEYDLIMTSTEVAEVIRCTRKHVTETVLEENPELEFQPSDGKRTVYKPRLIEWILSGGIK